MLLSYNQLREVVEQGYIRGVELSAINAATIDVRLGETFLIEQPLSNRIVDCANRESVAFRERHGEHFLVPMEFILAHTMETFFLPDHLSAEFSLKSSLARNGLEHLNACWIDAGFNNSSLTLELKNMTRHHVLRLQAGMYIGQIKVFQHEQVPVERSYATLGRYNGDQAVSAIKK